jgi:hypothetical protein
MTTMIRLFIQPDGRNWLDLQLADGQNAATVWGGGIREGWLVCDTFFVPMDSILYAATFTLPASIVPKPTVVPFKSSWPPVPPSPLPEPPNGAA